MQPSAVRQGRKTPHYWQPRHQGSFNKLRRTSKPDYAHGMRRFTRLTNGFSKKIENLEHAVALHFMHYNFCRIHKSLRVIPAMKAGIAQRAWDLSEVLEMVETNC